MLSYDLRPSRPPPPPPPPASTKGEHELEIWKGGSNCCCISWEGWGWTQIGWQLKITIVPLRWHPLLFCILGVGMNLCIFCICSINLQDPRPPPQKKKNHICIFWKLKLQGFLLFQFSSMKLCCNTFFKDLYVFFFCRNSHIAHSTLQFLITVVPCHFQLLLCEQDGELWVVLVAGSNGWFNYRHQACTLTT